MFSTVSNIGGGHLVSTKVRACVHALSACMHAHAYGDTHMHMHIHMHIDTWKGRDEILDEVLYVFQHESVCVCVRERESVCVCVLFFVCLRV